MWRNTKGSGNPIEELDNLLCNFYITGKKKDNPEYDLYVFPKFYYKNAFPKKSRLKLH